MSDSLVSDQEEQESGDEVVEVGEELVGVDSGEAEVVQVPPVPVPRRSARVRREPEWLRSGDFVVNKEQRVESALKMYSGAMTNVLNLLLTD